jgi:non-specific serine/threonine protein kinase
MDQGLIRAEPGGDAEARFRMHGAIRDFAEEVADDLAAARDRMLDYYVDLAERAELELERAEAARWARMLASEIENLRGALAWAYKSATSDLLVRLAVALGNFWRWHGDLREGREWLSRAVLAAEPGHESLLSKAQRRAAKIFYTLGERDQALLLYRSAQKNAEAAHDASGIAESLTSAAAVLIDAGRLAEAEAMLDEGFRLAQQAGDLTVLSNALLERGLFESYRGNLDEARNNLREAAERAEMAGNLRLAAVALVNWADTEFVAGNHSAAVRLASKGASYLDVCHDVAYAPWAHLFLGLVYGRLGDRDEAGREIIVGAAKALDGGSPADVILGGEVIAEWLGAAGKHEAAVACWAAATDEREGLDLPRQPWDDVWIDAGIERDRSALAPDAASAAWNAGVTRGVRAEVGAALEIVKKLLEGADHPPGNKTKGTRTHDKKSLTPRELEVLRLVTDGRSDKEIAATLAISPGTATAHVASIKWKLDASGRVEIATTAITRGLVTVTAKP